MREMLVGALCGGLLVAAGYEFWPTPSTPQARQESPERSEMPSSDSKRRDLAVTGGADPALVRCLTELDGISAKLKEAEMSAAFLKGQLGNHEGVPSAWPADIPDSMVPENLEAFFAELFAGIGEVVDMDCEEFPCVVVVQGVGAEDVEADQAAIGALQDRFPGGVMAGRAKVQVDDRVDTVSAFVVSETPLVGELGARSKFRMKQALEGWRGE